MNRHVVILERAEADIRRIFGWLYRRSPRGAENWLAALESARTQLAEAAEQCSHAHEGGKLRLNIRQLFFKTPRGRRYRIVFDIHENTVAVLRVRGPGQAPLRRRDVSE